MTKPEGNALVELLDEALVAIRADPLVGKGTCSMVDECMEDGEIVGQLLDSYRYEKFTTVRQAVKAARGWEELYLEQALNCREGNDDDPQLLQYREWKARRKEDGI